MVKRVLKIEFTRPKKWRLSWFSGLIRIFQKTEFSHVRLRWRNSLGLGVIYEASGSQIHFIGELAQFQKPVDIIEVFGVELKEEQYRGLVDLCMKYAGIKYGFLQIIGIALVYLLNLRKNPFADGTKSQVCSELVGRFIEEVLKIDVKFDLDIAGPKEINLVLAEEAGKKDSIVTKIL